MNHLDNKLADNRDNQAASPPPLTSKQTLATARSIGNRPLPDGDWVSTLHLTSPDYPRRDLIYDVRTPAHLAAFLPGVTARPWTIAETLRDHCRSVLGRKYVLSITGKKTSPVVTRVEHLDQAPRQQRLTP